MRHACWAGSVGLLLGCASLSGGPRAGAVEEATPEQQAALQALGKKLKGTIVWSSSRFGNHDILRMNVDGSGLERLTAGDHVDWFPRFSPDGRTILFARSRSGWVSESDANTPGKWDLFTMAPDGSGATKVADDASWGTWIDQGRILFVRGSKVVAKDLSKGTEETLLDGNDSEELKGVLLQQPQLSPDGRTLAITLRGSRRETGVWNRDARTWTTTGKGCQINWFPDGHAIYWVNPSGNGGSEVFRLAMKDGRPLKESGYEQMRFMDLPGRRSHEYFPQLTRDGRWMVWAATQRGHDHDIADYEIYLWEVGTRPEGAARLTFHSGNDRWPDLHLETVPAPGETPAGR